MENSKTAENNHVNLSGIISEECSFSHEVYGEGFYIFNMDVRRLSDNDDILPVTVSERLIDVTSLKKGMKVNVSGQLRSYNHYSGNKNRLILTAFAREISIEEEPFQNPNEIFLNGFVCKQPVYRTTPFGREITDLLVAVNRSYGKSDYIRCIAWGRNPQFSGGLEVGSNIVLWGRIQSRTYQKRLDNDTVEERTAYEVSISKIGLIADNSAKPSES